MGLPRLVHVGCPSWSPTSGHERQRSGGPTARGHAASSSVGPASLTLVRGAGTIEADEDEEGDHEAWHSPGFRFTAPGAAGRLVSRLRRGTARVRAWRPDAIVIRVLPEPGLADRQMPIHSPTTRRMSWSSEQGLSGKLPPSIRSIAIDCGDRIALMALARDPAMVARARAVTVRLSGWRAPMPGWTGRLGSLRGVTALELQVPRAGRGPVRVHINLSAERPIREYIAAIEPLLMPCAPLDASLGASLGANGRMPSWLSVRADDSAHFAGSPLMPLPERVDVISGNTRKPDRAAPEPPGRGRGAGHGHVEAPGLRSGPDTRPGGDR